MKKEVGQNISRINTMLRVGRLGYDSGNEVKKYCEIGYLKRTARITRLEGIAYEEIRRSMNVEQTIDRMEKKNLAWLGQLMKVG